MTHLVRRLAAVLGLATLACCGYALVGRGTVVDPGIKRIGVPLFRDATEDEVRRAALEEPRVREHLAGRAIAKFVLVPGRLVSVVVR